MLQSAPRLVRRKKQKKKPPTGCTHQYNIASLYDRLLVGLGVTGNHRVDTARQIWPDLEEHEEWKKHAGAEKKDDKQRDLGIVSH